MKISEYITMLIQRESEPVQKAWNQYNEYARKWLLLLEVLPEIASLLEDIQRYTIDGEEPPDD